MTHMAAVSIRARLAQDMQSDPKFYRLTDADILPITRDLHQDAIGLYYSALISFVDALTSIERGYFSWATVKLYYVCFYAARALLAINNCAIFYIGNAGAGKPFSLILKVNNSPRKERGVTHKVVWSIMERVLPRHPLIGDIGSNRAFNWMKDLREEINYRNPRFSEPLIPAHFGKLDQFGITQAIDFYVDDTEMLYALAPDHAALAFPVECLKRVQNSMTNTELTLDTKDRTYLRKEMKCLNLSSRAVAKLVGT
jgi:hypothetical protein